MAAFTKWAFRVVVALMTIGILVLGTFLVVVAVPDIAGRASVAPSASPVPSASPKSAMALSPVGIEMPANTDCDGCHVTTTGTVGTKPIPPMAHPLLGWRNCTACHSTNSLVQTAPGHSSLHKDECLICHQTAAAAGTLTQAPVRPEHMGADGKQCTDCHGVDDHAPMPESMKGRGNNCWICHNGPEYTYLFEESPSPGAGGAAAPAPSWAPSSSPSASGAPSVPGPPSASPAATAAPGASAGTGSTGRPLYLLRAAPLP